MNMEKCKYLLFCGTLALWMAGGFQQVYAATEPSSQAIQQQSNKVTGKVSDATGPIIGASVVEKGTANGTITDLDGNFSLNVKAGATLVVSYVGYKSEEVKAGILSHCGEYSIVFLRCYHIIFLSKIFLTTGLFIS